MTTPAPPAPIEVKASPAPGLLLAFGRIAAIVVCFLVGRHFAGGETVFGAILAHAGEIGAYGVAVATWGWELFDRWRSHQTKVALADALPDWFAEVRR